MAGAAPLPPWPRQCQGHPGMLRVPWAGLRPGTGAACPPTFEGTHPALLARTGDSQIPRDAPNVLPTHWAGQWPHTTPHTLRALHTQDPPPFPFNPTSKGLPRAFGTRYLPFPQEEHPQLQLASQDTPHPHYALPWSTPPPAALSTKSHCCPIPHVCCAAARNT